MSLDELRERADKFLTVSALATTLFAILKPDVHTQGADPDHRPSSVSGNGWGPVGSPSLAENKIFNVIPFGPSRTAEMYPDTDGTGAVESRDALAVIGPVGPLPLPSITSPNSLIGTVGIPLSFEVTTTGSPMISLSIKGAFPKNLRFANHHDGTGSISGTPESEGTFRFTVRCKFRHGSNKYVVTQAVTVIIGS